MSDLDDAMAHAQRLVSILARHGIQANAWAKPGVGARVYIGRQYIGISRGGDPSTTSRGYQTFDERSLFRGQIAKYRTAITEYRDETMSILEKEWRDNPGHRAGAMFERFHGREPRKSGSFHADLAIPDEAVCVGDAVHVLYRSDKLNPETDEDEGWIDYIHDHEHGVKVYRCDREAIGSDAPIERVPAWLKNQRELTWLGKCLGFAYHDWGMQYVEAKGSGTLPELYTIPSGKALLVIQGKRRLLAMLWGGRLGVEQRGIVH